MKYVILTLVCLLLSRSASQSCQPPTISLSLGNCTFSAANQTDVESWGVLLSVGQSTELCAVPSTVVNSTLLQSSEICSNEWLQVGSITMTMAQCRSRRGGYVTRTDLPNASTDGLDVLNPGWKSLLAIDSLTPFQYAAQASVQMRDKAVTMIEGLITQGQEHTASHLGLAEQSSLLQALKDAGLIGARSWGMNAGSQSYLFPRSGSLVLGGFDYNSINGPIFNYSIAQPDILNDRPCPLQVKLTEMTLNVTNGNNTQHKDFLSGTNPLTVCIEP